MLYRVGGVKHYGAEWLQPPNTNAIPCANPKRTEPFEPDDCRRLVGTTIFCSPANFGPDGVEQLECRVLPFQLHREPL